MSRVMMWQTRRIFPINGDINYANPPFNYETFTVSKTSLSIKPSNLQTLARRTAIFDNFLNSFQQPEKKSFSPAIFIVLRNMPDDAKILPDVWKLLNPL